jgi:iron complex outermembrane receptor protein
MEIRVTLFLTLALLFGGLSARADDNSYSLKDTVLLQEVEVISAAKTEVNRNQIPLTISVIDRQTIDESVETGLLSIAAEHTPGLFVTERSVTGYGISAGSAGTLNIHGVGGGNRVLLLFDGQPNWAGIFGHHLPDAYVASDADRIEVIRGPASLLYGSNAMGGIVNVITRKADQDGIHGRGRILYGSYNTWKFAAGAGLKKNKFNAYVSLNRDQSDGQRDNSDFYINNGYVRLGYAFNEHWNASGDAILADFRVTNPGAVDVPAIENWAKALRSTYSLSLNNQYRSMNGALQVFYNDGAHKINDGWRNGGPRDYLFRSRDLNRGLALYESFRFLRGNLITVGIDLKQWGGHAWNAFNDGRKEEIIDEKVLEWATYALVQQTFFRRLTLNAGIRLERNEGYGSEWIPQVGLAWQAARQTTFKASISKGFRSPNLRELYLYPPHNPDLKPERMINYAHSYHQSLFGGRLQAELTAYLAHGSNLIVTSMIDGNPLNVNTGAFTNRGLDASLAYRIRPNLTASAHYSFLHSDVKLTAAPKHKAYASLHWRIKKLTISPNVQYISGLYLGETVAPQPIADIVEHYTLLNCKLMYKAGDRLSFFLNGENLTAASYETYLGFPMPGVVVLGGIDLRF